MVLNKTTADALGLLIANTLTGLTQAQKEDPIYVWQQVTNLLYTALLTDVVVSPAGTPTPLTAPSGGGPVVGTGKVL